MTSRAPTLLEPYMWPPRTGPRELLVEMERVPDPVKALFGDVSDRLVTTRASRFVVVVVGMSVVRRATPASYDPRRAAGEEAGEEEET